MRQDVRDQYLAIGALLAGGDLPPEQMAVYARKYGNMLLNRLDPHNPTDHAILQAKMQHGTEDFEDYMEFCEDVGVDYEDAIDIWFSPDA